MSGAPQRPGEASRWRERLGWVAALGLAVAVACAGCFMLFALALTARGELEASVLGADWRVWQLPDRDTHGIGLSHTVPYAGDTGQACRATTVWLITWEPRLQVERIEDASCAESSAPRLHARGIRL